jgi:serine/threonine protein kinase
MAEREPLRNTPNSTVPGVAGGDSALSFDIAAPDGTADYPAHRTRSFPNTPDGLAVGGSTGRDGDGDRAEPAAAEPPSASPPGVELPHLPGYRLLGVLGGGGMGTVFKALHPATNRIVALKLINAGWADNSDFRVRFEREVKALAKLDHPHIVPIFDAGNWQGLPYLTMKFVPGKTLFHHMERLRRDPRAAARILARVARAVDFLHAKGIIHRDLKPLNILLAEGDTPLVADFGLVRLADDDAGLTLTLVPLGTRQYMSPEQTRGGKENYTTGCDIWALGIILYELLAGRRPFGHEDTTELYRSIRHDPLPPVPPEANAPVSLEAVARKCLSKAPADRYATAGDVAADLERWLAGEEIPLPPPETLAVSEPAPHHTQTPSAEPPRPVGARFQRSKWAVVGVMCLILGSSGATPAVPRDEPATPKSVADRLRGGGTVWIVGSKGLPVMPHEMPGGRVGHTALDPDGHFAVGTADVALVEFLSGRGLPPFVLDGEVALVTGNARSRFGFYLGRQSSGPGANASQCLYGVTVNGPPDRPWPNQFPPGEAKAEALYLTPTMPYLHQSTIEQVLEFDPPPIVLGAAPVWRPLNLRVTSEGFAFTAEGRKLPFATNAKAAKYMNGFRGNRPDAPPPANPANGGIGLFVSEGKALFRNVRLSPIDK